MCGFLVWRQGGEECPWSESERQTQTRVLQSIHHRGPDDGSEYLEPGLWMGFRRLSILDLSESGRQPMPFEGGRYRMVFNGEIYNYRELHAGLGSPPVGSTGDSAVLGALLSRLPVAEVLGRLRGMFAFCWWDRETRELVAARDPFGIKPLYFRELPGGGLSLGSELRSLVNLAGPPPGMAPRALAQYLRWGAVQAPETIYEGVRCLPPGHLLRWRAGQVRIERYHTPQWPGRAAWIEDPAEQRSTVRDALLESVQAHLVSDVPVGVFLSGGLDSTMMAASMRHLGCEKIQAFSVGYEEGAGVPDETDAAQETAKFLGCEFVRERISSSSLFEKLDDYFDQLDQPSGDALNTWLVSEVAARHVKVALSGLGADEWFGGYNYMRLVQLASQVRERTGPLTKLSGPLLRALQKGLPHGMRARAGWKALFYAGGGAGSAPSEWHATARTIFPEDEVAALLGNGIGEVRDATVFAPERRALIDALDERAPDAALHQILMLETESYLANTLLRDNDATSMAHSIELRVPLVDREIFALAGKIPPGAKLTLSGGKRILREAMWDDLPEWIRDDRKKKTFTLPLMKWMRTPKWRERIHDTLSSRACRERGWIDPVMAQRTLARYESAGSDDKSGWALSQSVWMLFVLESWATRNGGGPPA